MTFASEASLTSVKGNIAGVLREEIISGRLKPGEVIVEGRWGTKLKVAQASIREALNILATEGFVQKELGRSARVTTLTDEDVVQIHELRTVLESLAARLVTARKVPLEDLEQALADMHSAVECGNLRTYCERDVHFHLVICEKSGNRFLLEHVRRLIVPQFAFITLRQHAAMGDPKLWQESCEEHKEILDAIKSGDPEYAGRKMGEIIQRFGNQTIDLLDKLRGSGITPESKYPTAPTLVQKLASLKSYNL